MWVVMDQTKQKPFRAEVLAEVTLQHSRFETRGADPQGKGTQRESGTHHGERKEKAVKCQDSKKAKRREEH